MLNDKTFQIDYKAAGLLYSMEVNSIHVVTFGTNKQEMSFLPGTNTLRVTFSGINVVADIDG